MRAQGVALHDAPDSFVHVHGQHGTRMQHPGVGAACTKASRRRMRRRQTQRAGCPGRGKHGVRDSSAQTRGALLSVNRGFREAGLALGLSGRDTLRYVIAPLAFRRMIPALGNQWIVSIKDTSLFIVIGVGELTRQGQEIMAANFRAVEIWTAVAIIYLLLIGVLTFVLRTVEHRMRIL